jgi:hypothetical protein
LIAIYPKRADNTAMKSPKLVGFIQAAGLTLYISLFAFFVQQGQNWFLAHHVQLNPASGIMLFLLLFIISAIICASIMFAYPLTLFFNGDRGQGIKIALWSLIWLVVIAIFIALISFFYLSPQLPVPLSSPTTSIGKGSKF